MNQAEPLFRMPDWGDIFSGVCSALLQYGHFLTSCGSLLACLRAVDVMQGFGDLGSQWRVEMPIHPMLQNTRVHEAPSEAMP